MENIGASVGVFPTQEQKEAEEGKIEEEEEYHMMRNDMVFYLREFPECQISGVAEWGEDSQGDNIKELDTYFRHISTGQRCETPWAAIAGVAEFNEHHEEIWETLCMRIANHQNIEQDMCYEKRVEL